MSEYKKYLAKELFEIASKAIADKNRDKAISCKNELFRRIENKLSQDKNPSYSQLIWFYRVVCILDTELSEEI
tara:strand:+ start:564 stop:782 length:219 start_codon:yes stop_codon:yes gene_type:complete